MRQFDFYEFVGVLAPGVTLLFGVSLLWPQIGFLGSDVSLGDLGLAVLVAYVAGHLIQALGNLLETGWWWLWGGWPSDWPRSGKRAILSPVQREELESRLAALLNAPEFRLNQELSAAQWHPIFRQIYTSIHTETVDGRAHIFNGNYGMFRGIAAASLIVGLSSLLVHKQEGLSLALLFFLAFGLALFRMHRFAVHFAREVYLQFLQLQWNRDESSSGQTA